ncbi:MAG: glycosyltransferase family 4 protein [Solirubrobacterales bacterium]|nr:glycosyltransferase family 4 protein [Solirubrobacterales bacterium]
MIFLVPGETGGMEVYARELVPRLAAMDDLEVTAFVNQEAAGEDFGCERVVVPVNARNRLEWVRGEQVLLPKLAEARGCELVHSLASTAPIRGRFRRVVTIHDLMYKIVPEAHFGLRGLGMRVLVPLAARSAHRIIVDAESTREDLHEHLGTPRGKISVVPLAGAPVGVVAPTPEEELRRSLDLGAREILLTVSAKRPHKNLMRLLEALALLPSPRPLLVMPGYPTPHEAELRSRATELGLDNDVRFVGWTSAEDLEGLYALAKGFVFPSLYEGFGLPVLEAMARGVPVACSDRGSLAEVAGDAALLFDPQDEQGIATALARLLQVHDGAPLAGVCRAAHHSWDRTTAQTSAVYRRAA